MNIKEVFESFFFNLSIKQKLIISYIIVIIVPVFVGTYLPYVYTEETIVEEAEENMLFSMDRILELIKYKMEKYNKISNKLINDYEIKNYIAADYTDNQDRAYLASREIYEKKIKYEVLNNDEEILNIRIYKQNSTIPNYGDYVVDENEYKQQDWHKGVYNNMGVIYWKDGVIKSIQRNDIKTISLINRISLTESLGLLEIELRQDKIFDSIQNFDYKKSSLIGIIDQRGKVITDNSEENNQFNKIYSNIRGVTLENNDYSLKQKINDDNYLIISKMLNFQGWKVLALIPVKEIYATTYTIRMITLITAISCIIIFLFLTIMFSNLLTFRLYSLTKRMKSIEDGDFNVYMDVKGKDEVSELGRVFNSMVGSIRNLIDEVYKGKIEKKEAELRALQEQINPHFLYNSLSSINWMAVQANAPKIIDAVESLATFYRMSLNKGKEIISLKDEINQVKAYVSLQKLRYEDGFDVFWDVEPEVECTQIIKFIIQPFVENAIIHGFSEDEKGEVHITARSIQNSIILIKIIDNGKGMNEEVVSNLLNGKKGGDKTGYGIRNVNERIKIHYGQEYGIFIKSQLDKGTTIEIRLPLVK